MLLEHSIIDTLTATPFGYWTFLIFLGVGTLALLLNMFLFTPRDYRALAQEERTRFIKNLLLFSYLLHISVLAWAIDTFSYLISH